MKHISDILHWEYFPIILLVIANLTIGLLTVKNFGESWDEESLFQYGDQVLIAYNHVLGRTDELPEYSNLTEQYGPIIILITKIIHKVLLPTWMIFEVSHLVSFLSFQIGIFAFYCLSRRWLEKWIAFSITLLFSPLLWGHAFINPKDIPFMAFFVLTIFIGFQTIDTLELSGNKAQDIDKLLKPEWNRIPEKSKKLLLLGLFLGVVLFAIVFILIYNEAPWKKITPLPGGSHNSVVELELYIRQILSMVAWFSGQIFVFLMWIVGISAHFLPQSRKVVWQQEIVPILNEFKSLITNKAVLLASFVWGITIAIRVLALAAGILVGIYAISKLRRKAYTLLITYLGIALLTTYICWPYLWASPLARLLVSLQTMLQFPYPGKVLFAGEYYQAGNIPWNYLPTLLAIQLTIPAIILSLVGIGLLFWNAIKKQLSPDLYIVFGFWLAFPIIWSLLPSSNFYDNFRQLLFILPPLFISIGFALSWISKFIKPAIVHAVLIIAIILPGVIAIIHLHPYQYIYYNQFIGGLKGAFRNYELDYWTTSFQEATRHLNQIAPENSKLLVWGPWVPIERVIRNDIQVQLVNDKNRQDGNLILLPTRYDKDLEEFPNAEIIFTIERDGAILAVIKSINQDVKP